MNHQMGERKDRGCLNCNRNSIKFALMNTFFFVCMCIYNAKRMTRWESAKTGGAWTATETRSTLPLWIRGFSHISYICKAKNKSARAIWKIPPPLLGKGLRPPALEGRARARARARALSTTANHGISLFFKGNPRFDQGKSCSVPRVWQLCKISARSVPVSKRYDQRKLIKNIFSLKFIGHVKKSKSQDLQFSASKREFL